MRASAVDSPKLGCSVFLISGVNEGKRRQEEKIF
jgi:hypothetical protein